MREIELGHIVVAQAQTPWVNWNEAVDLDLG